MIADKKLVELENRARTSLSHKDKLQRFILVRPEEILAMAAEIRDLRVLADPQALTEAFMAGASGNKGGICEKDYLEMK